MNMVMNGESWTMTGYGLLPTGTLGCIPKVNSWSDLTSNFFRSLSYELPNLPKIAGITPAGGKMPKCWSVAGSHLSFIYPLIIFIWSLAYGRWDVSPIKLRFISSKWNDPQEPWTYQDSFPPFLIGSGSAKRLKISMFFPGIRDVIFFFWEGHTWPTQLRGIYRSTMIYLSYTAWLNIIYTWLRKTEPKNGISKCLAPSGQDIQ